MWSSHSRSCFHTFGRRGTRTGLWLESHAGEAGDESDQSHCCSRAIIQAARGSLASLGRVDCWHDSHLSCCVLEHQGSDRIYLPALVVFWGESSLKDRQYMEFMVHMLQMAGQHAYNCCYILYGIFYLDLSSGNQFSRSQCLKQRFSHCSMKNFLKWHYTCSLSSASWPDSWATRVTVLSSFSCNERISFCSLSPSPLTRDMALMRGNHSKFFSWEMRGRETLRKVIGIKGRNRVNSAGQRNGSKSLMAQRHAGSMCTAKARLQEDSEERGICKWRPAWWFNINHFIRMKAALCFMLDSLTLHCCLLDNADSNYTLNQQQLAFQLSPTP